MKLVARVRTKTGSGGLQYNKYQTASAASVSKIGFPIWQRVRWVQVAVASLTAMTLKVEWRNVESGAAA